VQRLGGGESFQRAGHALAGAGRKIPAFQPVGFLRVKPFQAALGGGGRQLGRDPARRLLAQRVEVRRQLI
jgi:hypothetical protein